MNLVLVHRIVTAIIAAFAVGIVVVLWDNPQEGDGRFANPDVDARPPEPLAQGILVPTPPTLASGELPRDSDVDSPSDHPVAPEGYSVVRHRGGMAFGGTLPGPAPEVGTGPNWLRSPDAVERLAALAAEAGRDWTFSYAELAPGATGAAPERSLAGMGATVVGAAGRLIRLRVPGGEAPLTAIAALEEVSGLSAVPPEVKLAGFGGSPVDGANESGLAVFVTLMEGDPEGRWRRSLEAFGAAVRAYDSDTRTYTAVASADAVRAMAGADFVAAVEPIGKVWAMNDTAVPAMGADALRPWGGVLAGTGGGRSVSVGVMDTGLNVNHPDIATGRESICGTGILWPTDREDELVEAEDLWVDADGHGTHVTGTILGNGANDSRFAGMAPLVRHIRFAKVLDRYGGGTSDTIRGGMDYLARESACGGAAAKPDVVNMSLGGFSRSFAGRTAGERKLDAMVWGHGQLYVVAQGNGAERGFTDYGAAKNSLSVGAVHDTGGHATFTSVGPTADGRLAPQVSGTGVHVHSARGGGSAGGYVRLSGTSMAAPSVTGVAALLMDAVPAHRGHPALARARLMASAIRPDAWLEDETRFPTDNSGGPGAIHNVYGLGKVSARTAVLERDRDDGWRSGSATVEPESGEYAYVDIDVPDGAARLDVVLTWDEPPADTIASSVLNDLDLWVDRGGDCGSGDCGEYSSTSRIDNVEWIIVRNPTPGTYRAKVAALAVYTAAPRAALAWTVIRGPSTPQLEVEATPSRVGAESVRDVRVELSVDGYVAAGTQLRIDCGDQDGSGACESVEIVSVEAESEEGGWNTLEVPKRLVGFSQSVVFFGAWFSLGEIGAGQTKVIRLRVRSGAESARLHIAADAWNARAGLATVDIGSGVPSRDARGNDDMATAAKIGDAEGSVEVDLFAAMPEPGEPGLLASPFVRRPASSAWYEWQAPAAETVHFVVARSDGASSEHAWVGAFEGERPASLKRIGEERLFGLSFAAEEGRSYRIRVASFERVERVVLRWFSGRPANDDFADAVVLEGGSGEVEGSNAGATLERGESWGSLAGTAWYRWTAPKDGLFRFSTYRRVGSNRT